MLFVQKAIILSLIPIFQIFRNISNKLKSEPIKKINRFLYIKTLFLSIFLSMGTFLFSQEKLIHTNNIKYNEYGVTKAFKKYNEKQSKKRLKDRFIRKYNKSVIAHTLRLNTLNHSSQFENKNWEGILNSMKSLQYLYVMVKSSPITASIGTKDYTSEIDSISNLATSQLYEKGKEILDKNENTFSFQSAYNYLKRAHSITPNYMDIKQLLEFAILNGTKNVFFEPVNRNSLGNFIERSSNKTSISSDFITGKLVTDLSVNNIGSIFLNEYSLDIDWIVKMEWISINMLPQRVSKDSFKRTKVIEEENDQKKTIKAIVVYEIRTKAVDGSLGFKVKDIKNKNVIINDSFSGFSSFEEINVTYTGDERALTKRDREAIKNNNHSKSNSHFPINKNHEIITRMYSDAIHSQIIRKYGTLFNWNYQ